LEHNGVELTSDKEIAVWNGMYITCCAVSEVYGVVVMICFSVLPAIFGYYRAVWTKAGVAN